MDRPPISDELLKQYAVLEKITQDSSCSVGEKISAINAQTLLFEHIVQRDTQISAGDEHALREYYFKAAFEKITPSDISAQWSEVNKRLIGIPHAPQLTEFPVLHEHFFEPACRGLYESCQFDEISEEALKKVKPAPGNERRKLPGFWVNKTSGGNPKVAQGDQPSTSRANNIGYSSKPCPTTAQSSINMPPGLTPLVGLHPTTPNAFMGFRTAREELQIQNLKRKNSGNFGVEADDNGGRGQGGFNLFNYGAVKKSLGARRTVRSNFVPPVRPEDSLPKIFAEVISAETTSSSQPKDERLVNIDPKMIELITNEIMHKHNTVGWDDIAGLEYAKSILKEAVVYPLLRPDLFSGLRRPPRGILLFGPPGTGKTLIGKCIASHSQSTFFSISASALTSKWVGDGEKMVRALFAVAAVHQPSVIFIDEIDSLLSQRSETEHESSRRIKTEFLVQLDGAATSDDDRILIVGATNRPQELDEAARRRFTKRLYIPLPESAARLQIINKLLKTESNSLDVQQKDGLAANTEGFSGADMESLCREASMEPIRSIPPDEIPTFNKENLRPVGIEDFAKALLNVRPSVSQADLKQYVDWNKQYGALK